MPDILQARQCWLYVVAYGESLIEGGRDRRRLVGELLRNAQAAQEAIGDNHEHSETAGAIRHEAEAVSTQLKDSGGIDERLTNLVSRTRSLVHSLL